MDTDEYSKVYSEVSSSFSFSLLFFLLLSSFSPSISKKKKDYRQERI